MKFPDVPAAVTPLYEPAPPPPPPPMNGSSRPETAILKKSSLVKSQNRATQAKKALVPHGPEAGGNFNYHSAVKVIQTKMYEPVADECVTVLTSKHKRNDADGADPDGPGPQTDQNRDDAPPQKPPRRKFHKIKKRDSLERALFYGRLNPPSSDCVSMKNGENCIDIDIDHIALESERNYKNKFRAVGVQTSPLVPYRLRFWPRLTADLKCDPEGKSSLSDKFKCFFRTLSQWFLSQIGLTLTLTLWALLGAAAFYNTEGPREKQQSQDLAKLQNDLAIQLSTDLRQVIEYEKAWPQTIKKCLVQHEALLLEAVSAGYGEGGGGSIWIYPGCILFAVSLLTTLGFGAPVPRTPLGRGAAVLFSAIGIPLHFLLILNIGNLIANKLQQFAKKGIESTAPIKSTLLNWFPLIAAAAYYTMGFVLFGIIRDRGIVDSLLFPLDFTAAGGVAKTDGHVRICYALYLEFAVVLAATIVSLIQASAARGIVDLGLRMGLLTNT